MEIFGESDELVLQHALRRTPSRPTVLEKLAEDTRTRPALAAESDENTIDGSEAGDPAHEDIIESPFHQVRIRTSQLQQDYSRMQHRNRSDPRSVAGHETSDLVNLHSLELGTRCCSTDTER